MPILFSIGLHREVMLYTKTKYSIQDISIATDYAPETNTGEI